MTRPKHRTVEHIRLFSGVAIKHYVIQADGPGAVVTLFITKEQTLEIWKQARLALMHAGEPDPLEGELESWTRRMEDRRELTDRFAHQQQTHSAAINELADLLDSPPREG